MAPNTKSFNESGWNLALEDQKRYAGLLWNLNQESLYFNQGHYNHAEPLWAIMQELWDEWRIRVSDPKLKGDMDTGFMIARNLLSKFENNQISQADFNKMFTLIRALKQSLLEVKKNVGFASPDKIVLLEEVNNPNVLEAGW